MLVLVALFLIGITTGTISSRLGLSGGILLVPILTLVFHLPVRSAIGASLMGIIALSASVAVSAPIESSRDILLALRCDLCFPGSAPNVWPRGDVVR